ncbi:Variant SH3 domain [Popillia japonica]|uniref:Variant SH3 domain n=1 Tax=Popillia japonica TaxID=7064 RepID=A0AAW1JRM1_POPJA
MSPAPSQASDKSKLSRSTTSLDSIKIGKTKKIDKSANLRKSINPKPQPAGSKENICHLRKAKKDKLNDEIVKKEKKQPKPKLKAKSAGTESAKSESTEDKVPITLNEIKRRKASLDTNNFFQPKSESTEDKVPITLNEIKRRKASLDTNNFFQHLFLRDQPRLVPRSMTLLNAAKRVWTRIIFSNIYSCGTNLAYSPEEDEFGFRTHYRGFKDLPESHKTRIGFSEPTIGALKIYLNHTKPVSDSKFRAIDAQLVRSRSASPKNVRWEDETKNILYERSSSLPPKLALAETVRRRRQDTDSKRTTIIRSSSPQKLVFSETSRPVSPIIKRKSIPPPKFSPKKIVLTETSRPISPEIRSRSVSPKIQSRSVSPKIQRSLSPETLYFSQTTRPVSPIGTAIRSPSYRKIRSLHGDSLDFIKRRVPRSRSAGEAEQFKPNLGSDPPSLTQSTSSIDSLKEYQNYVKEVIYSAKKSDRFKDLSKFYSKIERLGELERTTSSSDLRPRRKNEEEIIDYDRWKEVRSREKAEKELDTIYRELKRTQKEKDFLFMPKQVESYKWRRDFDWGLRIKEKSVEDIKDEFEKMKIKKPNQQDLDYSKDVYKPLWRGSSVANLAQNMAEKRSQSEGRGVTARQKKIESERLLTHGIGSRIWSSLSMEQVNVLKNQLAEIYQNGGKRNAGGDKPEYIVEVPEDKRFAQAQTLLKVRRNSDSFKTDRAQNRFAQDSSMTETDKKRLSQSLSKEILERQQQRYRTSLSLVLGKETRGAIAAADAKVKHPEPPSPRTCYSLEMSEDGEKDGGKKQGDSDFLLVLAKDDNKANIKETLTEWAQPKKAIITTDALNPAQTKTSSTSETESGSTDGSTKTVICADQLDKKDVKKKVQYFEKVRESDDYTPTVYKAADSSSPEEQTEEVKLNPQPTNLKRSALSRSYQDLKELFGESDAAKLPSPISTTSLRSLPFTYSSDSVYRSRNATATPISIRNPKFISRARFDLYYFSLIKSGDVTKLKNKFEPRRCNSDSHLDQKSQIYIPGQILGEVDNLRRRYEYPSLSGRGRSRIRRGGIVSPIHLKAEDRFMPHINIISKIASLYPRKSAKKEHERSVEELADLLGITVGEVKKLREKFDSPDRNMSLLGQMFTSSPNFDSPDRNMSLLGQMFTSSPNLNELRDIAPYLTGSWTAHKYPKKEDNTRPLTPPVPPPTAVAESKSSPVTVRQINNNNNNLIKKRSPTTIRAKSASPPIRRHKVKLSSILKPELGKEEEEEVKKKEFDPTVHRPVSRYQPQLPRVEPVRTRSTSSAAQRPLKKSNGTRIPAKICGKRGDNTLQDAGTSRDQRIAERRRTAKKTGGTHEEDLPGRAQTKIPAGTCDILNNIQDVPITTAKLNWNFYRIPAKICGKRGDNTLQDAESPRKYVENEVTIHYRTPVRQEIKESLSEDELQRRQAEHMKKIYQEERRRKYLQELQDMNSRRHADNFIPSQKSPIPLNRTPRHEQSTYDDIMDDYSPKLKPRPRSPEPRLVAKALYNFVGQSARELTFRKGDIIYIRRQVDKNWYEGEHNAMIGLFPANYVEIVPYDGIKSTVRKPHEGQARAKYNFIAQTHLELSLAKGELVVITRRVDDNWFEGKIGGRKGIFPVSYVEILIDPSDVSQASTPTPKPIAAPASHSLLLNGSLGGKESMGSHNYVPPYHHSSAHHNGGDPSFHAKPVQMTGNGSYGSLSRTKNLNQALHIDTQSDPVPYRALYKYKPQNEDELELLEGDTVYVLEKCDDGWYVGSSDRTGAFGTFPGNYVERI